MDDELAPTPTPTAAADGNDAQLLRTLEQLQRAKSGQPGDPASTASLSALSAETAQVVGTPQSTAAPEATLFGMSFGALMMGLLLSAVGLGCLRYAKAAGQFIYAIPGVIFLVVPWFVDTTWVLIAVFVGVTGLTVVVRRFVTF